MLSHNDLPQIAWQDLTVGALIGNGSFGDVYQGTWKGKEVALKLLPIQTLPPPLKKDFAKELKILWQCQSPFVLTLYGLCLEAEHCAVVMEYMSNGSLYHTLQSQTIPEQHRWQIALDIAKGLDCLHGQQVLHRDLKSSNILLNPDYQAKISDFDLAKLRLETSTVVATKNVARMSAVRWRAPELLQPKAAATPASDIYSFGMILWEPYTQKIPFQAAPDEQAVVRWLSQDKKETIPEACPEGWRQIIEGCWRAPERRPTAAQLVAQLEAARPRTFESENPKVWQADFSIKPTAPVKTFELLKASSQDIKKVQACYAHHPAPGYDIKSVEVIYNPTLLQSFALRMQLLQEREGTPAFAPKWSENKNAETLWRQAVHQQWLTFSDAYPDSDFPAVKLMPAWHGTNPEILDSLFRTGYANLATTDSGFFGKGIYSAHEAEYSYRVYSQGALVLNWIAAYSAYPVIDGDMQKLEEKGNFGNYDAHFVPVVPKNPNNPDEVNYYPTSPQQKAQYHEMVVFESTQCLPQYLVVLQKSLSPSLGGLAVEAARPPSPTGEAYYHQGVQQEKQKNFLAAFQYYQKASHKGYAKANTNLGYLYLQAPNEVVAQDKPKAFECFLEAANQGHVRAMSNLAAMLEYGDGVEINKAAALTWYQKICQQEPKNTEAVRKREKLQLSLGLN